MSSNNALVNNVNTPLFVGYVHSAKLKTILTGQDLDKGAVLGVQLVAAGTVTPDGGNTGDGTVTGLALSATGSPAKIGSYNLECVEAITNSGRFKLVDPDGVVLSDQIIIAVSSSVTPVIAGITFVLADGATDFIVGDKFAITVVAGSGKLVLVVSTATDGSDIPKYVLLQDADSTSGDITRDVGERGDVVEEMLNFGGSDTIDTLASNGKSYRENLKLIGILPIPHNQLANLDNQ